MKTIKYLFFVTATLLFFVSSCQSDNNTERSEDKIVSENHTTGDTLILIETAYGNMKIKLYDKTPKHKANFIKLAKQSFFDGLLFHRVINQFMIQGGDPDSKNAPAGKMLGNGGPGYEIDAEFNDSLFHKKGVIAAAREGDNVNPLKKSSGSQFYIVQGRTFSDEELDKLEEQSSLGNYIASHPEINKEATNYRITGNNSAFNKLIEAIKKQDNFKITKIPDYKRTIYKTIGGTPHLDNNYTVFGELVEGLDVIDKIAAVKTDKNDRPIEDVKMTIKVIVE
ncbi:MAG: peptidylprolyl isomerase [Bacteroidetes bacterium]|nr:MAG: peptidylprolyl isomerase [Bacteroidota bacterium]